MKIIVGHSNMDLDCVGSIVLARYLYPDHVAIRSARIHPATKKLLNLYEDHLHLRPVADLKGQAIERMVVVDTRSLDRVSEYVGPKIPESTEIDVWDHHPASSRDIPGARLHAGAFGSNTTQLGLELMSRGLSIDPEHATIALTGIYADTGSFSHTNVGREDFEVAAWLVSQGASLGLVKEFLVPLREREQKALFHEVLGRLESHVINGRAVQTCCLELEEDSLGLGAVIERIFEVENCELLFGLFHFRTSGRMLIIGRNSADDIRLDEIFAEFGGGGHAQAASATVKCEGAEAGKELAARFLGYLELALVPAPTALDLMSRDVKTLSPRMTMTEAAKFLEEVSHTGAPVVGEGGQMLGVLTLRDIQKGRKTGRMASPVSAFMSTKVVSAAPAATIREIDELFYELNIGHLPVLVDGRLAGIVTRTDILRHKKRDRLRKDGILGSFGIEALSGPRSRAQEPPASSSDSCE
jgi:tRNA nucleotidyltransferase (CCA-adding enzyme)